MRNSHGSIKKVVILTFVVELKMETQKNNLQTLWQSLNQLPSCISWSHILHWPVPPHKAGPFCFAQNQKIFSALNRSLASIAPVVAWKAPWNVFRKFSLYLAISSLVSSTSQEPSTRTPGGGEVVTITEWFVGSGLGLKGQTESEKGLFNIYFNSQPSFDSVWLLFWWRSWLALRPRYSDPQTTFQGLLHHCWKQTYCLLHLPTMWRKQELD